jgi:hypothetical protein
MTLAALFPSQAEVEAGTPVTRDRAIVAVMLIALLAARGLASDPQRVCAASLPAKMT